MSLFYSGASGTVTFLFPDKEGSTQLREQYPEAMKDALRRHDDMSLELFAQLRGASTSAAAT